MAQRASVYSLATVAYLTHFGAIQLGLVAIGSRMTALNGFVRTLRPGSAGMMRAVQRAAAVHEALTAASDVHVDGVAVTAVCCMGAAVVTNVVYMFGVYTLMVHVDREKLLVSVFCGVLIVIVVSPAAIHKRLANSCTVKMFAGFIVNLKSSIYSYL